MLAEDLLSGLDHEWDNLPAIPEQDDDLRKALTPINHWDPRLILDLAMGISSVDEILHRHAVTDEAYRALCDNTHFRRELAVARKDFQENGITFKAKAKIQAESYLPVVDEIINDPTTTAATRMDAIKSIVEWADLKPKKDSGPQQATQVNVNIVL